MNSSAYILFLVLLGIALLIVSILQLTNIAHNTARQLSWFIVLIGVVMLLIAGWIYFDAKPK